MSFSYLRSHYGVSARRGGRVSLDSGSGMRHGTITRATHHIHVRFDGDKRAVPIHPTDDGLTYLTPAAALASCGAPLTDLELAALRAIAKHARVHAGGRSGLSPSSLAYLLIEQGDMVNRCGKRRLRPQGAGFIGGSLLARLRGAGLADSTWREGAWLTDLGRQLLAQHPEKEAP